MNKYQKALDTIFDFYKESHIEGKFLLRSSIDNIRELVDRATPKEPKIEKISRGTAPCCPNCHSVVYLQYEVEKENFCAICGQALNWGE